MAAVTGKGVVSFLSVLAQDNQLPAARLDHAGDGAAAAPEPLTGYIRTVEQTQTHGQVVLIPEKDERTGGQVHRLKADPVQRA